MASPSSAPTILAINRTRLGLAPASPIDDSFTRESGADRRLLVYGTMRPGAPDAHVLEVLGGTWEAATFRGYLLGDGAACMEGTCPGLAWAPDGDENDGFVLTSDALPNAWTALDVREGADYARLLTVVRTTSGVHVANIYASKDASTARVLLIDGMNVHDEADFRT